MIKITKNLIDIPISLNTSFTSLRAGDKRKAKLTYQRRIEIIRKKKYIYEDKYHSRYKLDDIKHRLVEQYNCKCAYCEQWVEASHVEHYRPKSIYYWLAFSWDNLLNICPKCNEHKGNDFALDGQLIEFKYSRKDILNINSLSTSYDVIERPKLINPEKEDPYLLLFCSEAGEINSADNRMQYTIDLFQLNRDILVSERKKILDDFVKYLDTEIAFQKTEKDRKAAIGVLYRQYVKKIKDVKSTFIAFRKYHLEYKTIEKLIKSRL